MKKRNVFLGVLLTVTLSAGQMVTAMAGVSQYYDTDKYHAEIAYSDMEYVEYDPTDLENTLEDMTSLCSEPGHDDEIIADYEKIETEFDEIYTLYALNDIRYYDDCTNETYSQINVDMEEMYEDYADKSCIAIRTVLQSENYGQMFADYLGDSELVDDFLSYEDMTEEEKQLSNEETLLVQEYDDAMMANYEVTVDGTTYETDNEDDFIGTLSEDDYYAYYQEYYKALNGVTAEIYLKLVENRNAQAKLYGYDNYAEYAYTEVYNRDYTTEEIQSVYSDVKEYVAPIMTDIETLSYSAEAMADIYNIDLTGEEIVEKVAPYVEQVSPELSEAFDYLETYHLYDMDDNDTRMDVGYTSDLYSYGVPFIFNCTSDSYYDIETLIHEFGHFNYEFHHMDHVLTDINNMDVAEIHSQTMELFFLDYADEIYDTEEDALAVKVNILYNILDAVISGCIFDEFQNEVYAYDGELTVKDLNVMYRQIAEEYGYEFSTDGDEAYSWVLVSHTFESPMYYISYATSALTALDIWGTSLEDRQAGVDKYLELTSYDITTLYRELIQDVGLRDIFEEGTIEAIANETSEYTNELATTYLHEMMQSALRIIIPVLIIIVVLIILLIVLIRRHRKKRRAKRELEKQQMLDAQAAEPEDDIETEKIEKLEDEESEYEESEDEVFGESDEENL